MSFYDDKRGPSSIDLSQDKYTKYKEDVEPCYDEYPYEFNKLVEYQKANFNLTKDTSKYSFMERIKIASVNQMAELKHLISEEVLMNASFLDRLNGYSKLVDLNYDDTPSHYYENMKIEDGILYGDLYANYYYFHVFKDIIRSIPVRLNVS